MKVLRLPVNFTIFKTILIQLKITNKSMKKILSLLYKSVLRLKFETKFSYYPIGSYNFLSTVTVKEGERASSSFTIEKLYQNTLK